MAIREKLRLGDVLIQASAIDQDQLGKALGYQKQNGGQLGEILIKMCFISEERMLSNLAAHLRIPFLDMQDVKIEAEAVTKVNQAGAERHDLMPIAIKNSILQIAMANPLNIFAIDEVTIQSGMDVETSVASQEDIDRAIQEHYGVAASINTAMKSLGALDVKKRNLKPL
jgi:type IV pilus assembly protein PilB